METPKKRAVLHYQRQAAEARACSVLEQLESFARSLRQNADRPLPVMTDEQLEALGTFYEVHELHDRGVPFVALVADPYRFGWPVGSHHHHERSPVDVLNR